MVKLNEAVLEEVCYSRDSKQAVRDAYANLGLGTTKPVTNYELYQEGRVGRVQRLNSACFSNVSYSLAQNKTLCLLKLLPYETADLDLKKNSWAILRWVQICQSAGALPADQPAEDIIADGLWIDLRQPHISPVSFYIWGCLLRYTSEAPRSVINAVKLIDGGGHDFWAAVVISQYLGGVSSGHNFLNVGANPYAAGNQSRPELYLTLHQWARSPKSIDSRHLLTEAHGVGGIVWEANTRVSKPAPNALGVGAFRDPVYSLGDAFKPLWRATTMVQIQEQLNILKEEIPNAFTDVKK